MDQPSSSNPGSAAAGDEHQPHTDTIARPAPDNRFSVSPQLFVRSSDVLSKAGPKPPTRRRTRHKVLDSRLSAGDLTDGANPPAPPPLSSDGKSQRQSTPNPNWKSEADSRSGEGQAHEKEEAVSANSAAQGTVLIAVQLPEEEETRATPVATTPQSSGEHHGSSVPTPPSTEESAMAVGVHLAVQTDPPPPPTTAAEGKPDHVPEEPQVQTQTSCALPPEGKRGPPTLATPPTLDKLSSVEEEAATSEKVVNHEQGVEEERDKETTPKPPSIYLPDSSSDSDSDVELITAGYSAERYEELTPPANEEEESQREGTPLVQAEGLQDQQPGPEAGADDQPGEEAPKDIQAGEEVPKNIQSGEEASKNVQSGEEASKNVQSGEEASINVQSGEDASKNVQSGEEASKNVQSGEESPKPSHPKEDETPSNVTSGANPAGLPSSTSPATLTKPKRPPPPPKPPKPAIVPGAEATNPATHGAQTHIPAASQPARVSSPSSPTLSAHSIESNRLSAKRKVPPPVAPQPYASKGSIPPLPAKKVKPAPPPRAHHTHLSSEQSSLTTMPGQEPPLTPPIPIPTPASGAAPPKPTGAEEGSSIESEGPGASPSEVEDRVKHRPYLPPPPPSEDEAGETPIHLMSKPEYVHRPGAADSSLVRNSMPSPLSTSPTSTLTRVGRRLSVGLIKELATQEALASYDIISNSSEGEANHSVEEEDIYAIVKACNTATPRKENVSELPPKLEGFPTDKRSLVIHELYTTEHTYVSRLEVLIEVFKEPLSKILGEEAGAIFGNVDDIYAFNKRFLALLYERLCDWNEEKGIGDIFLGMFTQAHKSMYSIYCSNYDSAEMLLNQKIKRKDFELQLQQCLTHPRTVPGLTLAAYIILPVQRIPRYILLLKDIIKYTPESHKGYKQLVTSMEKMKELANYIDTQVKESQTKRSLETLKNKVQGLADLDSTERVLVKDGQVYLKNIKRLYQCILFSDLLVFAVGDNKQSAVDLALRLEAVWVEDLEDRDPQTSMEDAIEVYNPERPYTIYTCNKAEKKLWLLKLKETIYADLLKSNKCLKRDDMSTESRIARFVYNDGKVYSGDFRDAQCHGMGIMNWPNKSVYSGEWKDNERSGEGEFTFNTGDVYQGGWAEDKQTGYGELRYASNDVYRGWWKDGLQHGKGKIIYANGDVFEGHFEHGQIEGKGTLKCINGLEYEGEWKNSQREGHGVLKTVSGNVYTGTFRHDRMHGKGTMVYITGDRYEGSWKNGLRSGTGTLRTQQNGVYEGSWDRDMKHGAAKETYPNGDMYEGTFELNRRKGKGVLHYKTGEVYTGEFHNDLFHGDGEMKYLGVSKYQGSWVNGLHHGQGVMVYSDGSSYSGSWEAGLRSGVGELVCCDGVNYKGQWMLDKPHGRGQLRNPNAAYFYDGDWESGMREGKGTEQSPYGQYVGHWKNDLKNGRGQERAAIGTLFDGTWDKGRKNGRGTRRMVFGAIEEQIWKFGQLQNNQSRMTAAELPYVPRYDY